MSEVVRLSLLDARAPVSAFSPMVAMRPRAAAPVVAEMPVPDEPDDYARGFADGQAAAGDVFATEHAALVKLIANLEALQPEPSEELATMIATTVERLVTELVGAAPVDRDWLVARARSAADLIGDADRARTLWLHPDDLQLVEGVDLGVVAMADPALDRGALRIDCSAGWVEDGRSLHLDALRAELGFGGVR